MKIKVINPNTTLTMTAKIGEAASAVAFSETQVVAVSPSMGPVSVEGHYDEAVSALGVVDEVRKGAAEGMQGYLIACFDDPGLHAAREVANGPVVGIAEAACAATQKHLTGSRFGHLGSPLSDLPTLRARLARMRIETDKARAHLACAVDSIENPGPATTLLVLESKAQASETAIAVTDDAMRACGGAAFSKHLDLDRYFRDARAGAVMAPTSDVIQEFIGRALCGMELF